MMFRDRRLIHPGEIHAEDVLPELDMNANQVDEAFGGAGEQEFRDFARAAKDHDGYGVAAWTMVGLIPRVLDESAAIV